MVGLRQLLATVVAVWSCRYPGVIAYPYDTLPGDDPLPFNATHPFNDYPPILEDGGLEARQSEKMELRILPLGASIMSGVGSPEHSGLRKWLRVALRYDGYPVNMVGSKQDGTDMVDKDHEAVSGAILAYHPNGGSASIIYDQLQLSLGYRPNIVIINGGTNNANRDLHVDVAGEKMEIILNSIWGASEMAETCVILSTLPPTSNKVGERTRLVINQQYRDLVNKKNKDKCIWLADMEPNYEGKDFFDINAPIWSEDGVKDDKIHPNNEATDNRPVKAANDKVSEDTHGCDKQFGSGEFSGGLTQHGWGEHDGTYTHNSERKEIVFTVESKWDRNQWRFARLFSRDYDDMVGWFEFAPGDHRYGVWKNLGSEDSSKAGEFKKIDDLQGDLYCIPRGVRFIDMNGDGLDDLVCIYPDGSLYLSVNKGGGSGNTPPTFKRVSDTGFIKSSEGEQARVRLADIDGDGRADYGIMDKDGSIRFWRNGWINDIPQYWQYLGVRATIPGGYSHVDGVRFEDIKGDGRDDLMYMDIFGQTVTFTNTRSCATGRLGDGLNVRWRPAYLLGRNDYSHLGMREYYDDDKKQYDDEDENWYLRDRIHFARIYGTKPAFGNLGVQDYIFMEHKKINNDKHQFNVRIWKNHGQGGTKVIADGNKYCNMEGHDTGAMDYVWTWSHGKMKLFPNAGKKFVKNGESFWRQGGSNPHPDIWSPPDGAQWNRKDLHLADWDNDGDCDIIYVNPDNGNTRVFINDFPEKKSWDGAFREISVPHVECEYKRGIGLEDLAVQFADLTGNGRADYLCLHPDGTVKGYLHEDNGDMTWRGQLKFTEAKDRANLRFADVNGDGRDDMTWIDRFNSDSSVWYNRRQGNPGEGLGGSFFKWDKIGQPVYQENVAGACTYFPDLDGNGRADMHAVKGSWTNEAETWFNPSCGLRDAIGDDNGDVVDPHLPVQSGNPVDGAGPGDPGNPGTGPGDNCRGMDNRKWRSINCDNEYVKEDTKYKAYTIWAELDADGAWQSALEFYQCRRTQSDSSFSNIASDFFNGPNSVNCQDFRESGNGCTNLTAVCDHNCPGAARRYIVNSLSRIYAMYWNIYSAIQSMVVFSNVGQIGKDFGIEENQGNVDPRLAIILDLVVLGCGLVMGPAWK
ncbi:hypothetical protein VE02_05585 [Pseudogymnoascus sp. 03VT05]|nr:hypothetical protein VE02_05585 [Pseudogymnoascus sp. 03VT05]